MVNTSPTLPPTLPEVKLTVTSKLSPAGRVLLVMLWLKYCPVTDTSVMSMALLPRLVASFLNGQEYVDSTLGLLATYS